MNCLCVECSRPFEIGQDDLDFYHQVSPRFGGQIYDIPPPRCCPDCRQQRRLALANERNFYPAKCGLCAKGTISEHSQEGGQTVYCRECWFSDKWDATSYGREFDFSRSFFSQFDELRRSVPAQNLCVEGTNENSEYIHYAGFAKNCYLITHADFCEDCYYGYGIKKSASCVDGFYNLGCELCYDCVDVHKSYDLIGCQDCINCSSSAFLRDCIGCKSCFLCVGLRNKEYCFENVQLSKEQYLAKMSEIDLGSYAQYQNLKSRRAKIEGGHPFKEYHGHNLENCAGDYIVNCKDTHSSFDCEDVERGKFLYQVVTGAKNDYDVYQYGLNLSESYECAIAGNNCYHILFTHNAHVNCSDLIYCWFAISSKNCFGSVSLNRKEYCILNKQYSKDEYEALVPTIIEYMKSTGEWGEMFPVTISPFGYNKTNAIFYYPLSREEVIARGWKWDDSADSVRNMNKVLDARELPDSIDDVSDDILNEVILCGVTAKPFKITPQELKFYRRMKLPLPRLNPSERHLNRFRQRNPRTFWNRKCGKCDRSIVTTYETSRPELVYCEQCYHQTVY